MIGTSAAAYAFIRVCVFFLHAIAPLSLLYCAAALVCLPPTCRLPTVIELWFAAEALFWTCFFPLHRRYLQHAATHPPMRSKEERRTLVDRVNADVADPERYIRGWFKGARIEEIGREDVKTYLAWAFFDRDWGGEEDEDEDEIEEYAREIESMLGKDFPPGKRMAKPLRLTLDPVNMLHRSLLWYLCVGVVDFLAYLKLQRAGFHFYRLPLSSFLTLFPFRPVSLTTPYRSPAKHLTYWYRPHTSATRLPILFIHGIGIGLYPYTKFLAEVDAHVNDKADIDDGQVGILAVEIMPISLRITHAALDKDDMCAELHQILASHGYERFVLISHSYGSVISAHILSNACLRPMVASVLLIDPVSFLLHMPDVAYNFTVRKPQRANEWQLWYFASKDPGIAHSLGRRFFWSENIMWKEDAESLIKDGKRVTVTLGGRDLIVDTKAVGRYLANSAAAKGEGTGRGGNHAKEEEICGNGKIDAWKDKEWRGDGLEVLWFDHLDHAQVFDKKATRARLAEVVRKYCETA